jgi:thymidylate synthase
MYIEAQTADELFTKTYSNLQSIQDESMIAEIVNANLCLKDPTRNTMCECSRKMPIRYAIGEFIWYNSRNTNASSIEPFSKYWGKIAESDGTVNSNYGYCIHDKFTFDQWNMVKELLKRDRHTRQAIIHIKEPRNVIDNPTKDLNCTIALQFLLRNNKLDMITTMRSNDIWLGLPYDVFNFTCMQMQMAMELDVEIGVYYHNVGSLHLYKKDANKITEGGNK